MSSLHAERSQHRSRLLLLVFGASLILVAATGTALIKVVGQNVLDTAKDASVASDQSLVNGLIALQPGDVSVTGVPASRVNQIQDQLEALMANTNRTSVKGIVHVKIFGATGVVLYSNDVTLRGQNLGRDDDLARALATNKPSSSIVPADEGEAATTHLPAGSQVLEEYIPIVGANGTDRAVFEIYRDGQPILAGIAATTGQVILIVLAAALLLAAMLLGIFQAAQGRLTRQTAALFEASRRDALTGLFNHGTTVSRLADLLEQTRTDRGCIGVALVDIDNFRLVNDTHGHSAGDLALLEVARILRSEFGDTDIVGRYGPDEFLVIAPPEHSAGLERAIDRLRDRIADLTLQFGDSERLPVTVSAGICYAPTDGDAATELLAIAALVLGEAKASGGNGVRVADAAAAELGPSERSGFDVLAGLITAVDTKDRYTKRHSEDVARYSLLLADRLQVESDLRRTIEIASLLHDVGKIGVPDVILRKPGPLTADEQAIVRQHVALGDLIVRDVPNAGLVRAGVRHHHERWDGGGYPDGLAGEDIPLIARIVAVSDTFSAMTTTRPYRKALPVQEALSRLEEAAGSQLDPNLVRSFAEALASAGSAARSADGRPFRRAWNPQASVA